MFCKAYLYSEDTWHGFFDRLRSEDPVHFVDSPMYGPYWSVIRYRDIMTVDTSHLIYSSDATLGGIALKGVPLPFRKESFIAMDPPRHDEQRKIVSPIVAPPNLAKMSTTIRERAIRILEDLPRGEVFDWVDRVSVELEGHELPPPADRDQALPNEGAKLGRCTSNRERCGCLGAHDRAARQRRVESVNDDRQVGQLGHGRAIVAAT